MPCDFGGPCKCACVFSFLHAKLRVHRVSGIPCALTLSKAREFLAKLGRLASRDRGGVSAVLLPTVIARKCRPSPHGPPLSAIPRSTGCNAAELQRQPPAIFWNANDFSILTRCATAKLSWPGGARGPAFPDRKSQQVPVQPDAIGLQTANGDRKTISPSAFTRAHCS